MRAARRSVFETNSSSTHSVTISKGGLLTTPTLNKHGNKVVVYFGQFGWGPGKLVSQKDKLSYLCTVWVEKEGRINGFEKTKGYKLIDKAIAEYCNCDGIVIGSRMSMSVAAPDGKPYTYFDHEGYIDHQSLERYKDVEDFLKQNNTDVINFVFNPNIVVNIDNDNRF
jgi:hypothetical protein